MKIYNLYILALIFIYIVLTQQAISSQYISEKYKKSFSDTTIPSVETTTIEKESQIPTNIFYEKYPHCYRNKCHLQFAKEQSLDDTGIDYLAGNSLSQYWIEEKRNSRIREFFLYLLKVPFTNVENMFFSIGMMKNLVKVDILLPFNPQLTDLRGIRWFQYLENLEEIYFNFQECPIGDDQVNNLMEISKSKAKFVRIMGLSYTNMSPSSIKYLLQSLKQKMPWANIIVG